MNRAAITIQKNENTKSAINNSAMQSHAPSSFSTLARSPLVQASSTISILTKPIIQPKLKIGAPNDKYEQEADRVADQVMRMPESGLASASAVPPPASNENSGGGLIQRTCASCTQEYQTAEQEERPVISANLCPTCRVQTKPLLETITPLVQRQELEEEEEEILQAKSAGQVPSMTPDTAAGIQALRGGGSPLPESGKSFFNSRIGYNFSNVRIHTSSRATELAQSIRARAFTLGNDVVFGAGQYQPDNREGKRLIAHELTHVVQQGGNKGSSVIRRQVGGACTARFPENCPTYELWLSAFRTVARFRPIDGALPTGQGRTRQAAPRGSSFSVLGHHTEVASRNPNAPTAQRPPAPVGTQRLGERFIDHPTDQWVSNNLPPNLRATAYQLPADCADVFVILRHVYLAAHNRTERYRGWLVGSSTGRAEQRRIGGVIRSLYSGNAQRIVNPYSDTQGRPIRDFQRLQRLLHPGDQLVWDHFANGFNRRRSGGHTQTISEIIRNSSGNITAIDTLQGNQPLGLSDVPGIVGVLNRQRAAQGQRPLRRSYVRQLEQRSGPVRAAPGRRIEVSRLEGSELSDTTLPRGSRGAGQRVWTWNDPGNTVLVVAGPPRSASRPSMRRIRGQRMRRISDWFARLGSAGMSTLHGVFEAALHETRALIDGGQTVPNQDAMNLGRRAGGRLWNLAKRALRRLANFGRRRGDLRQGAPASRTHFEPLHRMRAMIRALGGIQPATYLGNPQAARNVHGTFTLIDTEFNYSARGGEDIGFHRRIGRGGELVKVLVTGFDPFNTSNVRLPPRAGEWNPSGAAAIAMDGTTLNLGGRNRAAVEGAVFPVSYAQFNQGIVERAAFQVSRDADAVLTVSVDPNLAATAPVRIEQFAVGVHNLIPLRPHRLFPVEPASPTAGIQSIPGGGPAIRETTADVAGIAQDTATRARGHIPQVQRPDIGQDITLRFQNLQQARRAVQALGLSQQVNSRMVVIDNATAVQTIMRNSQRVTNQPGSTADIVISIGNTQFQATLLEGPGGSFLSNEIAYRMQRELSTRGSSARSFHVHTPAGQLIPQATRTRAQRTARNRAMAQARSTLVTLIATLRSMIRAVAQRVLRRRRQQSSGGTP